MNLQNPPEIADGGYWYVVPIVADPELGGLTPGDIPGTGWCAWYGDRLAAVRCPEPVVGLPFGGDVSEVLSEIGIAGKPVGRVGGL